VWVLAGATSRSQQRAPQNCDSYPLNESEVARMIPVSSVDAVIRHIQNCGVTFIPDAASERRLRAAGATDALLALIMPPANPAPGSPFTPRTDHRTMRWAPAGVFSMGSAPTEPNRDASEVQHQARIATGFWIDEAEVSRAAYQKFLLANRDWQKARADAAKVDANYLSGWDGTNFPAADGSLPAVFVSWSAASAYCTWAGKRLPTEVEWEYAARAGTTTAYWWGNVFAAAPMRTENADSRRNPWHLVDVLGNAWEWTSSLLKPYPYRADDGREDPQAAGDRVLRGGASGYGGQFWRSAMRNSAPPVLSHGKVGFRCVR
jgi:formylglycine-generating enzyme required for sulfatase activity